MATPGLSATRGRVRESAEPRNVGAGNASSPLESLIYLQRTYGRPATETPTSSS